MRATQLALLQMCCSCTAAHSKTLSKRYGLALRSHPLQVLSRVLEMQKLMGKGVTGGIAFFLLFFSHSLHADESEELFNWKAFAPIKVLPEAIVPVDLRGTRTKNYRTHSSSTLYIMTPVFTYSWEEKEMNYLNLKDISLRTPFVSLKYLNRAVRDEL